MQEEVVEPQLTTGGGEEKGVDAGSLASVEPGLRFAALAPRL